jgi:hypothetical protein
MAGLILLRLAVVEEHPSTGLMMPNRRQPVRTAPRPESQPVESDVAAIFERRLLARGIRPEDFIDWRGSAEIPSIPAITTIRFGRGSGAADVRPLAIVSTPQPAPSVELSPDSEDPDPDGEPDEN